MNIRVAYSDHLVGLIADAAAAAQRLALADPAALATAAAAARRDVARLSARLDASPLDDDTAAAVDAGIWPASPPVPAGYGAGGWAAALRLDGMATQEVAAVEYANLLAVGDAEAELSEAFFDDPLAVLRRLHGLICHRLVDPALVGRPRGTPRAITDGAQGRVLFNAPDAELVPGLLAELRDWLGDGVRGGGHSSSATMPGVVVAAVVSERLLEWQPFEAGNGRMARAAARLVLRARGVDPGGVAVVERSLAADPAGYYGEVAATIRRRGDLGLWTERHTEAVLAGLHDAVAVVDPRPQPPLPPRAAAVVAQLSPAEAITVPEYAARAGVSRELAMADLRSLAASGALASDPRTRGLRFRRRGAG